MRTTLVMLAMGVMGCATEPAAVTGTSASVTTERAGCLPAPGRYVESWTLESGTCPRGIQPTEYAVPGQPGACHGTVMETGCTWSRVLACPWDSTKVDAMTIVGEVTWVSGVGNGTAEVRIHVGTEECTGRYRVQLRPVSP